MVDPPEFKEDVLKLHIPKSESTHPQADRSEEPRCSPSGARNFVLVRKLPTAPEKPSQQVAAGIFSLEHRGKPEMRRQHLDGESQPVVVAMKRGQETGGLFIDLFGA